MNLPRDFLYRMEGNRFNNLSNNYLKSVVHSYSSVIRDALENVDGINLSVVDIGCGAGHFSFHLLNKASEINLVDPSENMLKAAKRRLRNRNNVVINLIKGHAEEADDLLLNNSFDLVVSRLAFHHFDDPERSLISMVKLLKNTGKLIIIDLQGYANQYLAKINHEIELFHDPTHRRSYHPQFICDILTKNHMQIVRLSEGVHESEEGVNIKHWCQISEIDSVDEIINCLRKLSEEELGELGYTISKNEYRNHIQSFCLIAEKCQ